MICKAVYDNESDVPAAFKDDFTKRADGKWVMKDDAVPGAAELLNPGLAANKDRALQQKTAADEAKRAAETRASELETQLNAAREPGGVILSKTDAAVWQRFQKLGDVKEVEKIVSVEFPRLKEAETLRTRQTAWAEAAADLKEFGVNLNFEVLSDLMTHPQRGAGLEIERRPIDVENATGQKVKVNFPHIVERVAVAGKEGEFELKATPLLDFAAAKWPAWAVAALTAGQASETGGGGQAGGGDASGGGLLPLSTGNGGGSTGGGGGGQFGGLRLPTTTGGGGGQAGGGLKLPAMGAGGGGGQAGGGSAAGASGDPNAVAKEFNERRDAGRTSPLARGRSTQQPAASGGGGASGGGQK